MTTDTPGAEPSGAQRGLLMEAVCAIRSAVGAEVVHVSPDGTSAHLVIRTGPGRQLDAPHRQIPASEAPAEARAVVAEAERILAESEEPRPDDT